MQEKKLDIEKRVKKLDAILEDYTNDAIQTIVNGIFGKISQEEKNTTILDLDAKAVVAMRTALTGAYEAGYKKAKSE